MADFDAIVIGSGMSGGWAAKELCERGMKTLVLERGKDIDPAEDYTDMMDPWEYEHLDRVNPAEAAAKYAVQKDVYVFFESTKHLWARDDLHPYATAPDTTYQWLRGYHVGGRSLLWARMSFRLSDYDFNANLRDGIGVDWPIRYADLEPWYDRVEEFVGVSGESHSIPQIPAGKFLPPFEMNTGELWFREQVESNYPERDFIIAPCANLSVAQPQHTELRRGNCQVRNKCFRGCSFGAYFSSNSATLPAADNTGNLTLKADSIVHSIIYDPETKRATGVRVIDAKTKATTTYTADIIFLNASAIPSAMILLNSASETMPNGLANSSDQVGRNLMDHVAGARVRGTIPGMGGHYYGRRPAVGYIPRYVNLDSDDRPFKRGFAYQVYTERDRWSGDRAGIGADFKTANRTPGKWTVTLDPYGEVLPYNDNRVTQSRTLTDAWGLPAPVMNATHRANERAILEAASAEGREMLERAGLVDIEVSPVELTMPGNRIHEMGTARMGRDPATSVLNKWNQCHDVENLFITDGSAMTSSAVQNPSITYMALTARAANHAADLKQQGAL